MRRQRAILAALLLGAVATTGCGGGGGGDSNVKEINAAIDGAQEAAVSGDAAGFCSYLSANVIAQLKANDDINSVVPTCADLVDANSDAVKEVADSEPTITSITVKGDKAYVTGRLGGQGEMRFVPLGTKMTIALVREDGRWKLATLPPL
jgi:hypothetical protein